MSAEPWVYFITGLFAGSGLTHMMWIWHASRPPR